MITVTVYVKQDCPQCDQVLADLESLVTVVPHQVVRIDIAIDRALQDRYGGSVPVVEIGPYRRHAPITRQDLMVTLNAARDRVTQLEKVDQAAYQQSWEHGHTVSDSDNFSFWLSKHYLLLINLLIFIYVGLPVLAPVLMKVNAPKAAEVIYTIYSPTCHQLAYRSWFLFGEQAFYPRELAGIAGVESYEKVSGLSSLDLLAGRKFRGNETVGYKMALCERDVAMYGSMLLFGVIFALSGRRMRSVSWILWLVLGLAPIGFDGVSQLPSVVQNLPAWLPMRESTPLLRSLTGVMFGWMTGWYLFPMIEDTMGETRRILQRKFAVVKHGSDQLKKSE